MGALCSTWELPLMSTHRAFLLFLKADLELLSKHDEGGMTPLMMADKYGHVYICAELVLHQVRQRTL